MYSLIAIKANMKENHGMTNSDEYGIWTDIKTRCTNSKSWSYKNYGGRGIVVCDRWKTSFLSFYSDMGPRPSKDHSIERIDNSGNYEKSNCKWATSLEQGKNKRNNVKININGVVKTQAEWSRESGVSSCLISARIKAGKKGNELIAKAGSSQSLTFNGITDTVGGWSKRTGIKLTTISMRINQYKWSVEKALTKGSKF